jgi:hypothetical protein
VLLVQHFYLLYCISDILYGFIPRSYPLHLPFGYSWTCDFFFIINSSLLLHDCHQFLKEYNEYCLKKFAFIGPCKKTVVWCIIVLATCFIQYFNYFRHWSITCKSKLETTIVWWLVGIYFREYHILICNKISDNLCFMTCWKMIKYLLHSVSNISKDSLSRFPESFM